MNKLRFVLKFAVTILLFLWLIKSDKLHLGSLHCVTVDHIFVLFMGCILFHLLLQAIRWKFVVNFYSIDITVYQSILISWIGNFFSLFLPGAASGEFVRGYYVNRLDSGKMANCISSLIVDRTLGMCVLLAYSLVSCSYLYLIGEIDKTVGYILLFSMCSLFGILALMLPLFSAKAHHKIDKLIRRVVGERLCDKLYYVEGHSKNLIIAVLFSIGSGLFAILGYVLASHLLREPITFCQGLLYTPIIILANTLPISPGGLGVGESVSSLLLARDGYTSGAEVMLVYRIGISLLRLPGGVVYLLLTKFRTPDIGQLNM